MGSISCGLSFFGFVAVQGVYAGNRHPTQLGADFDHHATIGRIGRGTDFGNDEVAFVFAFRILVKLGVFDDKLADMGGKKASVEVTVSAVDGFDGQLPG